MGGGVGPVPPAGESVWLFLRVFASGTARTATVKTGIGEQPTFRRIPLILTGFFRPWLNTGGDKVRPRVAV
jgi:hypothetical protein